MLCRVAAAQLHNDATAVMLIACGLTPFPSLSTSQVASSLADMLYAQQKFDEAQEAVATALDAAENSKQWALYIKLSNNMGAVLRRLEKHDEVRAAGSMLIVSVYVVVYVFRGRRVLIEHIARDCFKPPLW